MKDMTQWHDIGPMLLYSALSVHYKAEVVITLILLYISEDST